MPGAVCLKNGGSEQKQPHLRESMSAHLSAGCWWCLMGLHLLCLPMPPPKGLVDVCTRHPGVLPRVGVPHRQHRCNLWAAAPGADAQARGGCAVSETCGFYMPARKHCGKCVSSASCPRVVQVMQRGRPYFSHVAAANNSGPLSHLGFVRTGSSGSFGIARHPLLH